MKPVWVVQANFLDQVQMGQVMDAIHDIGADAVGLEFEEGSDYLNWLFEEPTTNLVIPFGSVRLTKLAQKRGWLGSFYNPETFRVSKWLQHRQDLLNQDAQILTVQQVEEKFRFLPLDEPWHIRPDADLKEFRGQVTSAEEIARWSSSYLSAYKFGSRPYHRFGSTTLVAVASPKEIWYEYRWFVVDGQIVSGCVYWAHGNKLHTRIENRKVIAEAQAKADAWLPLPTCVMDLALTPDGLKVIEFNTLNSCGFYYHDIKAVVKAVTESVTRKHT